MCGIAGILAADGQPLDVEALHRMDRCIAHRGPDDAGTWLRPDGGVALAHRRLAILDLSAAGHQPFFSNDGRVAITYNGEIYNFRELRLALESRGCAFRSASDTEVIVNGYLTHGAAFVEQLRGMFAFALWDERERLCLLARDRFGIKPLYYSAQAGRLVFASEMRAVLASRMVGIEPDPIGVQRYFQSGSVPEPHTLLRNVSALEAGQLGVWQGGQLRLSRYWSMGFAPAAIEWDDAVARTRAALVDSVRHHFVSDVPVGVFLSGGIDSTALVALARQAGIDDLHTFSVAFPGHDDDEGKLAQRSAARFGTTHHEWALDAPAGRELFAQFVAASDQPSIDGLNTFAVSKFARDNGLKVVLSGLGADELFGGYKSFRQVPLIARGHRAMAAVHLHRLAGRAIGAVGGSAPWRRLGESIAGEPSLTNTYLAFRGIFTPTEAQALTAHYTGTTTATDPRLGVEQPTGHDGDAISTLELTRYTRNQLLRDADVMSMAWGLELRVPFLDAALFETVRAIPADVRLREHKQLLTAAVPELPIWVVRQPKRGFLFPIEQWLDADWKDVFAEVERSAPVPAHTWYRKWCLFMLDRWMHSLKADADD
jgi:asparagine synthase (glutamine-hydrolysing)